MHTLKDHAHWVTTLTLNTDFVLRTGPFDHLGKKTSSDIEGTFLYQLSVRARRAIATPGRPPHRNIEAAHSSASEEGCAVAGLSPRTRVRLRLDKQTTSLTTSISPGARTETLQCAGSNRRRAAYHRLGRPHTLLVVALPFAHCVFRCSGRRGGARREAEASCAPHGAPTAGLARRVQPGRAVGGERGVGQQRARVGRAHGQVRRDAPRARRGSVPACVERGFKTARQCEQRQHAEGECRAVSILWARVLAFGGTLLPATLCFWRDVTDGKIAVASGV